MAGGYTSNEADVEHSAEFTSDTLVSMLLLDTQDQIWQDRALAIGNLTRNKWTGVNSYGLTQFQSTYLSSEGFNDFPLFACDTAYHSRVLQPLVVYWQQNPEDQNAAAIILAWLDNWIDVTQREQRDKPAGVMPSAVWFPSGIPGGPLLHWWNPGCHYSLDTFAFPRGQESLMKILVQAANITGSDHYLQPILSMLEIRKAWLEDQTNSDTEVEGTLAWVGRQSGADTLKALAKLRQASGRSEWDEDLLQYGDMFIKFILTDDMTDILLMLEELADFFSYNKQALTTEIRFSDRIFELQKKYLHDNFESQSKVGGGDIESLYSMVTGDPGKKV